jgi:hypothetical protein
LSGVSAWSRGSSPHAPEEVSYQDGLGLVSSANSLVFVLGLSVTGKSIVYNGKERRKNRALRNSLCLLDSGPTRYCAKLSRRPSLCREGERGGIRMKLEDRIDGGAFGPESKLLRVKEVVGFKEVFQGVREDSLKNVPCNNQE